MKTQTINEIDVAELLVIAKSLNKRLSLYQKNFQPGSTDYGWIRHQRDTIQELVTIIGDEQTPWWKQIQGIGQLADAIPRIRCRLGVNIQ